MTADVKSRQEKKEEEGEVTSAKDVKGEFTIWFKFCILLAGCFLRVSISGREIGESNYQVFYPQNQHPGVLKVVLIFYFKWKSEDF